MWKSRIDKRTYEEIAKETYISQNEIRRAVISFFDSIIESCRHLPLDNARKIYSKEMFDKFVKVWNVPFIGRIGLSYTRYLAWRRNESGRHHMVPRGSFRSRIPQSEIEDMAAAILSGKTPSSPRKRKKSEMFHNVWYVKEDGKKLAKQVIKKNKKDVQD